MNSFRIIYYITVYLLLYNDAIDDQSIIIYPRNSSLHPSYAVLTNTSQIYFKNFIGRRLDCTYGGNKPYETQNHFDCNSGILKMFVITKSMSTIWNCTGYDGHNDITIEYNFQLRVKGSEKVNVTIGGEHMDFKSTNLSVKEYDGIYDHACEEEDTIDLSCENTHDEGHIQLKYFDANGANIFDTKPSADKTLRFRKLVRDKNANGSYIECSYITPIIYVNQTFTYRVIFTVLSRTPKDSGLIVTINDMKLSAISSNTHSDIYEYEYKFVKWVPLKLICENKDPDLQLVNIRGDFINSDNVHWRGITSPPSKYSATIETKNLNGAIFECYTAFTLAVSARILFSMDAHRDPFIQGLLAKKILYQYNTDYLHWIIHYKYEIHDVLNLTCFTDIDSQPKWVYDRENITSTIHTGTENNSKYINNYFHMNDKVTKSISCESNKNNETRVITILLHTTSEFDNSDFVINPDDGVQTSQTTQEDPLALSNGVLHLTAYAVIGIVAGVVITVVATVCAVYWWRARRLIVIKEEAPYKSFNQVDDHEYTYIQNEYDRMNNEDSIMKTNDLYNGGVQDNSRKPMTAPIENQYTEIDIKRNPDGTSITYAVPYEIHNIKRNETSESGMLYNNLQGGCENINSNNRNGNSKKDCSHSSVGNVVGHLNNPAYNNVIVYANK